VDLICEETSLQELRRALRDAQVGGAQDLEIGPQAV